MRSVALGSEVGGLGVESVWKWNRSGSGRIGAVGTSVVGGVNVVRVKCKEDGGNECDG